MADVVKIAKALDVAERGAKSVRRFTASDAKFTLLEGYKVQKHLLALHEKRGAVLVGRKMGMTSKAKMQQMGIADPIHGFLTDDMQVVDGGEVSLAGRIHAKIEPEIAFILGRTLQGNPSVSEAMNAVAFVVPALEIIDSRYENFEFELPDVVADNCSASAFVLGSKLVRPAGLNIGNLGILLECNGKPMQFGSSSAILGHPGRSLVELVRLLDREGKALVAGSIVLAGGATAAIPLTAGDWIRAQVEHLGSVEVKVRG